MQGTSVAPAARGLAAISLPRIDAPALFLIVCSLMFGALALLKSTDPDYWWHLRTGQLIVQTHSVPRVDSYSFTAFGKDWVPHEWLSEVLIYALQSLGGYTANVLFFAAISIATLLITYRTALFMGVSRWAAAAFFMWAALMGQAYWVVRPQVLSFFLLAVFIGIIVRHQRRAASLWLLPPLMVLWVNLHLGCMFGLGVVGLYATCCVAERLLLKARTDVRQPLLVTGACFLATFVTPFPDRLLPYMLRYVTPGNNSVAFVSEWKSPDFHSPVFLPLALALVALVFMGAWDKRRGLFLPLLTLVFALLALFSVRNQPMFAVVFGLVGAVRASDLWRWAAAETKREAAPVHSAINLMLAVAVALALVAVVSRYPNQLHETARLDGSISYPSAGVDYVRANEPQSRIFATYQWGGYVIDQLHSSRVFIDGRSEFYGDELLQTYVDVTDLKPGWQQTLDRYGVDVLIIERGSALAHALDAEAAWKRVFRGPIEAVYVRSGS